MLYQLICHEWGWQLMLRAVMFVLYQGKDLKYMAQHLLNSFDKCVKSPQPQS